MKHNIKIMNKITKILLHALAGCLLICFTALLDQILVNPVDLRNFKIITIIAGLLIFLSAFMIRFKTTSSISANLSIFIISMVGCILIAEGFFRVIRFDFAKEKKAWQKIPLFYRQPMVPTGEVFFRRSGNQQWSGQALSTRLKQLGIHPNPYINEPVITVATDSNGFRNPGGLADWDIAVAGDSFTELGYLNYEELFTTVLQRKLNKKVLNLGASYSGPLSQLSYLKNFGISASTKHAVIIFFEGNDLKDLSREYENLLRWQQTGKRRYRIFKKQTSMLNAFHNLVNQFPYNSIASKNWVTGYFISERNNIPITLYHTPPGKIELPSDMIMKLNYFFREFSVFAREKEVTPWLVFMPCKRRVLHGFIQFNNNVDLKMKNWLPSDLPDLISGLSENYGINFIDLTFALVRETEVKGTLLYNSIYDSHINALGSKVIAEEIARNFLAAMNEHQNLTAK